MSFHSKWVIFRVKLSIYQRVHSRPAAATAESPHPTSLVLVLVDSPAKRAGVKQRPNKKLRIQDHRQ